MSFLARFHLSLRKNGMRFGLLGPEPLCCPLGELLDKQASATRAERQPRTCKRSQDHIATGSEMWA